MKMTTLLRYSALLLMLSPAVGHAEQSELRFSWWGGNQRHEATREAIDQFKIQNPEIVVKMEPSGWDGHLSRLSTQLAGSTEPDIMQVNWNWLEIFSKKGDGFYDLNKLSKEIDLSQFSEQGKNLVIRDGKLNGIPIALTARLMYYNADVWKKAGLDYPKNWEEILLSGPVFKNKLGDDYYPFFLGANDTSILTFLNSYMTQKYNIPMINEDKKGFNYTHEQWLDFFGMYKKLVDNHVIPSMKYFAAFGKANAWEIRPWIEGKLGGTYIWTSEGTYADSLKPPSVLVLGPYPMIDGAKDSGLFFKPSQIFAIGKNSKNPEQAAKLINFMLNDPAGIKAMGLQRGIPLSKVAVETLKAEGALKKDDIQAASLQQVEALTGDISASPYFENQKLLSVFLDYLQQYDYGKKSLEEVATEFPKSGERILKRAI